MLFAAAGLGLLIGLVLGCLGGGGGVLTVPVLVYLLGQSAQAATTGSLLIVGITAAAGALARVRSRLIDWRTGLAFGVIGVPAAYVGSVLNQRVNQHVLLVAFAAITILAAIAMLINSAKQQPGSDPHRDDPGPHPDAEPRTGTTTVMARGLVGGRRQFVRTALKVSSCALVVGFLTGFLGVGGGFLVTPALVITLQMPMNDAIGTSLMIIVINSAASMASRIGAIHLDWTVVLPFIAAAVIGSVAGKRVADRFSGDSLNRAFAVLLILVAGFVATQSLGMF